MNNDYTGSWHIRYWYPSNDNPGTEETSEYNAAATQTGHEVVFQSTPTDDGSYLLLKLSVDNVYAAGSWTEDTAPKGQFGGMIYSGVVQLIVEDDGRKLRGIWAGVGREVETNQPDVYSGRWEMTRQD